MKLARTVLAASALALAGTGYAAKDKEPGFNALDKDNDGFVSRSEAANDKSLMQKFKEADKNNDGKISRTEYLTVKTKQDVSTVKEKVTGKSDQTASAGATTQSKENKGFNEMDKNSDGMLTRTEAAGNKDLLGKWKEADKNNDDRLSRTEYLTVMAKKDATTAKEKVTGKPDQPAGAGATKGESKPK
jgi:EF-hand domain pair/EF hand